MSNYRNKKQERLAEQFKVLGHPHRLAVLGQLARCRRKQRPLGACVAEAGEGLGLAPSTVSHHVKELRQAGLISVERRGREVHCQVNEKTVEEAIRYLEDLLASGEG
jgi:ArsR family transcriptional regulator